ncbi:hypothetical protein FWN18_20170 [Salmonella enterica]|nr:hypothetical protein [Salmonella enterica]
MMTADWFLLERDMIPGALACAVRGKFEKSSISAGYVGIMPEVICWESTIFLMEQKTAVMLAGGGYS